MGTRDSFLLYRSLKMARHCVLGPPSTLQWLPSPTSSTEPNFPPSCIIPALSFSAPAHYMTMSFLSCPPHCMALVPGGSSCCLPCALLTWTSFYLSSFIRLLQFALPSPHLLLPIHSCKTASHLLLLIIYLIGLPKHLTPLSISLQTLLIFSLFSYPLLNVSNHTDLLHFYHILTPLSLSITLPSLRESLKM